MWSRNVNNAVKATQRTHSLRRPLNEHKPSLPTISQSSNTVCIVVSWSVELAPALIPRNLCSKKSRETHFKEQYDLISITTHWFTTSFSPELTLPTNAVRHGIMEEFGGDWSCQTILTRIRTISHTAVPGKGQWLRFIWWPLYLDFPLREFVYDSKSDTVVTLHMDRH